MFRMIGTLPLLGLFLVTLAQDATTDNFLYPGRAGPTNDYSLDPVFPLGTTQHLQWNTDYSSYNLTLWQQSKSGGAATPGAIIYAKSSGDSEVGGFDWIVQTYSLDLDNSNVFFIWAVSTQGNSFTSHYFNITASAVSSSVTSSATSSVTSTPASSTSFSSATTPLPPTPTTSAATQSPQPQNSDTATKVGLGVGLGLGIPIVLLLGIYVGMKVVKTRRTPSPDQPVYVGPDPPKYQVVEHIQERPREQHPEPVELPARGVYSPRELP